MTPVARIALLHGPNLDLLGEREPHLYGSATLQDHVDAVRRAASAHGLEVDATQASSEGDLVRAVHAARGTAAGMIVNPGALTHYAWSLADALATFDGPVIEVHITNPDRREPWRRTSVVAPVATGTISGLGMHGYELAVAALARRIGG